MRPWAGRWGTWQGCWPVPVPPVYRRGVLRLECRERLAALRVDGQVSLKFKHHFVIVRVGQGHWLALLAFYSMAAPARAPDSHARAPDLYHTAAHPPPSSLTPCPQHLDPGHGPAAAARAAGRGAELPGRLRPQHDGGGGADGGAHGAAARGGWVAGWAGAPACGGAADVGLMPLWPTRELRGCKAHIAYDCARLALWVRVAAPTSLIRMARGSGGVVHSVHRILHQCSGGNETGGVVVTALCVTSHLPGPQAL